LQDKQYTFYSYDSDDHLFKNEEQVVAVARDLIFFRSLIQGST